jgi:pantoate--beta-alanine ligase
MGALHEGHLSLVRLACSVRRRDEPVVASVFVNPTQFTVQADLDAYPRPLERDLAMLAEAGADVAFCPSETEMYPPGVAVAIPELPLVAVEPGLEDAGRPGHFAGVCQVVARLFEVCRPRAAVFGEKDWQQLQVVSAMARGLSGVVEIIAGPIVREADGLAMSSRNARLGVEDRRRAAGLRRALVAGGQGRTAAEAEEIMQRVLAESVDELLYAVVRDAEHLTPLSPGAVRGRALVCAHVGGVRLLDNAAWAAARA